MKIYFANAFQILVVIILLLSINTVDSETTEITEKIDEIANTIETKDQLTDKIFENIDNNETNNENSNKKFWKSFFSGFNLIFVSEIGDKTFLLCLFFSLKIGAFSAFLVTACTMVCLNAIWLVVGATLPILIYQKYINWFAVFVFLFFAIYLLIEGIKMENKLIIDEFYELEKEENAKELSKVQETETSLSKPLIASEITNDLNKESKLANEDDLVVTTENCEVEKKTQQQKKDKKIALTLSTAWSFSLSLVLAEMGDKSQITAIAIAAIYNFKGVLIGSSLAHVSAALIAATIGYYFSSHVSEKFITLIGSLMFFIYSIDFFLSNIYS